MKAKDKAEELIDKFSNVKRPMFKGHNLSVNMHPEHVKQCALICVNNIIASNPHSNPFNTEVYSTIKYWQEVKQEIYKL